MRTVREQALDGPLASIRIKDAIALDRESPGIIESDLTISGILRRQLGRFHKEGHWFLGAAEQDLPIAPEIQIDKLVEPPEIGQEQPIGLSAEKG